MGFEVRERGATLWLLPLALLSLLTPTTAYGPAGHEETLRLTVYSDGFVLVEAEYEVAEPAGDGVVSFPLLARGFEELVVSSDAGDVAYYVSDGVLILEAGEGVGRVLVSYVTQELTRKEGRYWELVVNLTSRTEVLLPEGALVVYLSGRPDSIGASENRPMLVLPAGMWVVGYTLENGGRERVDANSPPAPAGIAAGEYLGLGLPVAGAALAFLLVKAYRRRYYSAGRGRGLSEDELRVLSLVRSRGRVSEAEIRGELRLPKTTVWRVVRRLERRGVVRVRKVGNRNEVEPA